MQQIFTKTAYGISFGDNTYKVISEVHPWLTDEKAWVRSVEVVIYGCKNSAGQPVAQSGWFGVGNSYNRDAVTGNDFLFNWIEPGRSRTRTQFPSDCGMDFPQSANEPSTPYFRLMGLVPASVAEFTWFMVLTYTKEPLA